MKQLALFLLLLPLLSLAGRPGLSTDNNASSTSSPFSVQGSWHLSTTKTVQYDFNLTADTGAGNLISSAALAVPNLNWCTVTPWALSGNVSGQTFTGTITLQNQSATIALSGTLQNNNTITGTLTSPCGSDTFTLARIAPYSGTFSGLIDTGLTLTASLNEPSDDFYFQPDCTVTETGFEVQNACQYTHAVGSSVLLMITVASNTQCAYYVTAPGANSSSVGSQLQLYNQSGMCYAGAVLTKQ